MNPYDPIELYFRKKERERKKKKLFLSIVEAVLGAVAVYFAVKFIGSLM